MVPEGQGEGHKRGNYFYICILERIFKMKHLANSIKVGAIISCRIGIQVYSKEGPNPLKGG
jgi:hypothetical protein